ncbi:GNAT family N-acetyltransferase [Demequina sediminicola]|uniref:GNAT family N-acetyltransferase n=1 Tax=Demequina sediminicola TaxID=1095026 RepID=UPI000786153A|nr:GNAT family N-acetyltransferase [Demequina sediminicola]
MLYRVPHRIETERLVIRRYVASDAQDLATVVPRNVDHLKQYMEWVAFEPQSVDQRRTFIADVNAAADEGRDFTLGMFLRTGALIGGTGFHVRDNPHRLALGYWIDSAHAGHGYVTEACAALTQVGLALTGATIIEISHAPSNERSRAVPQRLGYERQTVSNQECFDAGSMTPAVSWYTTIRDAGQAPWASTERPRALDVHGNEIVWPQRPATD